MVFFFLFSLSFPWEKAKDCHQGEFGIFRLTCLSQEKKKKNTKYISIRDVLSEVIAAKINSLQAVSISIDNKLDGLDARVAILESSDGNTDQNTEWLEGKVKKIKNTGREHLRLLFLQYHQRQRGLWTLEGKCRQKKRERMIRAGAIFLFSPGRLHWHFHRT